MPLFLVGKRHLGKKQSSRKKGEKRQYICYRGNGSKTLGNQLPHPFALARCNNTIFQFPATLASFSHSSRVKILFGLYFLQITCHVFSPRTLRKMERNTHLEIPVNLPYLNKKCHNDNLPSRIYLAFLPFLILNCQGTYF